MKNKLRVLLWAAVHSDHFPYCYIAPLLSFRLRHESGYWFCLEIRLRLSTDIRIPWSVEAAYQAAHRTTAQIEYDDIPF